MARAIGINHVALEVGDVGEALDWYARFFDFELRGSRPSMAWIDLGDQFLALSSERRQGPDDGRHFGLVVDDKEAVRAALAEAGVDVPASGGLRFRDPWGIAVEIVDYRDVQFTKTPEILAALAPDGLQKHPAALEELARKGVRRLGIGGREHDEVRVAGNRGGDLAEIGRLQIDRPSRGDAVAE
ncbi:MAG TPA: VOC family protein, partial [Solirubrobacteraceae bacterium]|nr:VOC family protein [Solirubrobacteraceae bacterium]